MNNFEKKLARLKDKLVAFESYYGRNNYKSFELRRKIAMYEEVSKMSHTEVGEQISHTAGEIAKLKTGYYGYCTSVDKERKLLKVLTERIRAEKQEEKKNNSNNCGSIIEIGHSIDDNNNGFQC